MLIVAKWVTMLMEKSNVVSTHMYRKYILIIDMTILEADTVGTAYISINNFCHLW